LIELQVLACPTTCRVLILNHPTIILTLTLWYQGGVPRAIDRGKPWKRHLKKKMSDTWTWEWDIERGVRTERPTTRKFWKEHEYMYNF
jgi:hypothetical protein